MTGFTETHYKGRNTLDSIFVTFYLRHRNYNLINVLPLRLRKG